MKTVLFLLLVAFIVGCGGSGISDPGPPVPAKYVGVFHGTFAGASGDQGTMALTCSPHGNITGTVTDQTDNANGNLIGKVSPTGHLDLDFEFHNGVGHLVGQLKDGTQDQFTSSMTETGLVIQNVNVSLYPGP